MNIVKRTIFDIIEEKERDNDLQYLYLKYENACESQKEEAAAEYARRIRDALLKSSDREMLIDRWIECTDDEQDFFEKIKHSGWGEYRAHLRNIPEQEGFPFEIDWGEPPIEG